MFKSVKSLRQEALSKLKSVFPFMTEDNLERDTSFKYLSTYKSALEVRGKLTFLIQLRNEMKLNFL